MAAAAKTALQRDLSDRQHAIRKKLPCLLRPIVRQIGGGRRPEPELKASPAGSGAHIRGGGDLAQQQAQQLMEDYVKNIVSATGSDAEQYTIEWIYLDK